jgi:hypothetical protein
MENKINKNQGEVTSPRDPFDEADPSKKIKFFPTKPTLRKKSRASKTTMRTVLTVDDFDFIIIVVADTSQDVLQKHEAKKEDMYDIIEVELSGVQKALQSICAVSTASPPSEAPKLGDEPTQLCRLVDAIEAHLHRTQKDT